MKTFQLYHSEERIKLPEEDAWAIDHKNNVFAVADGVHLLKGIEYQRSYPAISPAGTLAQKFCDNFLRFARIETLKSAFLKANRSVFSINKNRDKYGTFSKAEAYFAATGAFGKIKNRKLEWGNICDSGVVIISAKHNITFWRLDHSHHGPCDDLLRGYSTMDGSYMLRTIFRNAISQQGKRLGYGVITGEPAAEKYAWFGTRKLNKGDLVVFTTDGFEQYLQEKSFRIALRTMDEKEIEIAIAKIKKANKGNGEFISERTLVAVLVD
jgi:serine/threonine protein phosphatase PrpC